MIVIDDGCLSIMIKDISLKSTTSGQKILKQIMDHPAEHA